jgi:Potential Queuosine, Q, salvage protein family
VFFYKRAQILVADIYGALTLSKNATVLITNIEELTMFADYRVPQILYSEKVLEYSEELRNMIVSNKVIAHGSEQEVEIRSATIQAVELIKSALLVKGIKTTSIQIDWLLWQKGEVMKDSIMMHHKVLSIFY